MGQVSKCSVSKQARIGVNDPSERICPWDPGEFRHHGVPTLFLKGGSDPVIAGHQAESSLNNGVTNAAHQAVLLEFNGRGHSLDFDLFMNFGGGVGGDTNPSKWTVAHNGLLEKFLELSPAQFRQDAVVIQHLRTLNAKIVFPVDAF